MPKYMIFMRFSMCLYQNVSLKIERNYSQWLEKPPLLGDNELREIGNLICEKRKARGWSQNDLAGYMGSDYRVVSRHENGHGMTLESLVRYSKVFDCPMVALLPAKFHQNISGQLLDVLTAVAVLPEEKQNKIAAMIRMAIDLAA